MSSRKVPGGTVTVYFAGDDHPDYDALAVEQMVEVCKRRLDTDKAPHCKVGRRLERAIGHIEGWQYNRSSVRKDSFSVDSYSARNFHMRCDRPNNGRHVRDWLFFIDLADALIAATDGATRQGYAQCFGLLSGWIRRKRYDFRLKYTTDDPLTLSASIEELLGRLQAEHPKPFASCRFRVEILQSVDALMIEKGA